MNLRSTDTPPRADLRTTVLDVTARLLREQGADGVTTRAVAAAAGIQAPTIYRLFGDKDGLLDAVAEHVMATYVTAKRETARSDEAADPVDVLREGWRTYVEFGLANPDLFVLLVTPGRTSAAAAEGMRVLAERIHRVTAAGRLRVPEQRAVEMVHAAGVGAVLTVLAAPTDRRDLGLADAMLDALCREILTDAPAASARDAVSIALAFRAIAPDLPGLSAAEHALLEEWLDRSASASPSVP
ncbi:TetR/AcrR family transcriptional regulator [Luteipulveratus sp. YIM 133132]|uniref:TetR/AcrR family transcriptional regulator n=1 Tax=Luteipulveratus flavus TaxID=3031728 RepID=A0ABT6C5V4_9MICO|nr:MULTISPECIES: TetR/AcrR family transcriptional regulator [unclassified Luteipulveratus]MDE9364781.1 TetR/AcrR family transcriptional regulator [Luteipulveratus sp. YIM 133132]MDF8262661.1 TetR/AcrR family transcriptional regulator [Luteipulveratus sp. YIM 133296]